MKIRLARREDVPAIVALLADDPLGAARESDDMAPYLSAFDEIASNPMHQLLVAEEGERIIATLHLTVLAGLSHAGARHALVEAVRVAADLRSSGIGAQLMQAAEDRARAAGCRMIQLTSDRSRVRAHHFYERLGYQQTHVGMKKLL